MTSRLDSEERQRRLFPSGSPALTEDDEETVIMGIGATDVALGLRRIPAGFYAVVRHSGLEWRTENKRPSVDDVVGWNEPIPIPPDLSVTVCLEVYASFEFQPILGSGEQLRKLTIAVEQLLDRSEKDVPFVLFPKDGEVVSPCSSVFVTVKRWKCKSVLGPHLPSTRNPSLLEDATNQGHEALSRYRKYGRKWDIERSIEQFEVALSICPPDHPCRSAAQSNLATAKFILYRVDNRVASLDVPLALYRGALAARPVGHPDRPSTLLQLAAVYFVRSTRLRDEVEEAHTIELLHEAMSLNTTYSHEHRAATFLLQLLSGRGVGRVQTDCKSPTERDSMSVLADEDPVKGSIQLLRRFERFHDLADLHRVIAFLEPLVTSTLIQGDRYCICLANLGVALWYRFKHLWEPSDLEAAISIFKKTVNLIPDGHPERHLHLHNLGNCLTHRFERLGELSDLETAISALRDAVDLVPYGHCAKPGHLHNLGDSLKARFHRLGELNDLEDAMSMFRAALDLAPHGHPAIPGYLNNLGDAMIVRFERLGELTDLENGISMLRDVVDITPNSDGDKPLRLNNLGNSFSARFRRLGELSDLDDAISAFGNAVDLTPDSHSHKTGYLNNLGSSFFSRFIRLGELSDLEGAISIFRDAIDLIHHGHPDKLVLLANLGNAFLIHFERLGELSDLQDAISALNDVADLTPHDHPNKPWYLHALSKSLIIRFQRLGELSDLDGAISLLKHAVDLTPQGHPNKPGLLGTLGCFFDVRFGRLGELNDLKSAVSILKGAVDLTPHGHPGNASRFRNLAKCLLACFKRLGEQSNLETAISMSRNSVELTPHGDPCKPLRLNTLATCFITRFQHLGEPTDLGNAISIFRDAVELTPNDHPQRLGLLNNLSSSLKTRFWLLGELSDLGDSILWGRGVVDLAPHDHPQKLVYLYNLAGSHVTRFERLGEQSDLERAIALYSHAASTEIGAVSLRFSASKEWISCARRINHHSLLHGYSVAVNLLHQLAWIGLPLTQRYAELTQGADVVREAAAAALDSGHPETAVEWLEQGRSIVWGELFQLRSSYEELSAVHPDYARQLQELSTALELASSAREKSLTTLLEEHADSEARYGTASLEEEGDRHRALANERGRLLQEIRRFPGFERFLLQREFSQLRASAHAGPVVILNAAERRCDALVVLADVDHVVHVPLPHFTFDRSAGLQMILTSLLGHARSSDEREGKVATRSGVSWEFLLSTLWNSVVKPVLDALAVTTPGDLSRIFWCPTGPFAFLPIHAAGSYDAQHSQPGHKVFDFVVSSYVPTLSILSRSSNLVAVPTSDNIRLLAVRQPPTDGLSPLPGVEKELAHIKAVMKHSPSSRTTLLESSVGTVEEVLDMMKHADWVHFACHGIQDDANPTDSGLCLAHRRRLRLRDMVALSRPHGGLAFLSACQTAMGNEHLSDEAIHVAAGMLFAGYGGVIGTMWSISDKLAPRVARDVYEQLFRHGVRPDYREAAMALHRAIERLRESGDASFVTWLPFIHVGF